MLTSDIGSNTGICYSSANIWQIVGYILLAFKIIIPIILIIYGIIDLGKAVVGSKEDDIKKAVKQLAFRVIAGVVIFLIPTLISVIMGLVSNFNTTAKNDFDEFKECIVNPGGNSCVTAADRAWGTD